MVPLRGVAVALVAARMGTSNSLRLKAVEDASLEARRIEHASMVGFNRDAKPG